MQESIGASCETSNSTGARPTFVNGEDSVELELRMLEKKSRNSEHFSRNKNVSFHLTMRC